MWILYIFLTLLELFGIESLKMLNALHNKTIFKYGPSERQPFDSGTDENGPCERKLYHNGRPMGKDTFHQALVADKDTQVSLVCHYCNDSDAVVYGSILWFRVSRGVSSQVSITEVIPDMHDEEDQNRVVISPTHTLTFKSIATADAGGYFCLPRENSAILNSVAIKTNASSTLTKLLSVPGKIRFFYHLDVLPPIGFQKIKQVSFYGHGRPKPQKKIILPSRNLVFYTAWQEWARCSICGRVGERKRYGVRMIAKNDPNKASTPWYLDRVLRTFTKGVPCRSTLLKEVKGLPKTADEIDTELCDVACHRKWIYSGIYNKEIIICQQEDNDEIQPKITNEEWRKLVFDTKHKVIRNVLIAKSGDVFKIECQGASVDSMVWWKNGTKSINSFTVPEDSLGRVRIDSLNNLIIRPVSLYDAGKYSCWINGKLWAMVKLKVYVATPKKFEGVWYHAPYFCTVLSSHFWLFLSALLLRHAYRLYSRDRTSDDTEYTRFWQDAEGRYGVEQKERQKKRRLEKYGDNHKRMLMSGGAVLYDNGSEVCEERSLIEPWKDVRKIEQDG